MTENIYLFVPNIIGYGRIVFALISFYYMPTDHVTASFCYILSGFLDALDGHAARYFGQCTKFGAMLDQLTDRAATMCLLVVLSHFYPAWMFWFQLSMTIDIVAHWLHLHVSTVQGSDSHKKIDLSANPILYHYYTNRNILFLMCMGNEAFYSMLYLCYFTSGPLAIFKVLCVLSAPVALAKTAISCVHLYAATENLVAVDAAQRQAALVAPQSTPDAKKD